MKTMMLASPFIGIVMAMTFNATAGTNPAFHDQMMINTQQMKVAKHVSSVPTATVTTPQTTTHHK